MSGSSSNVLASLESADRSENEQPDCASSQDESSSSEEEDTAESSNVAIVVMGITGAGKSTFINHLTRENVEIGHSLQSCTTETYAYIFERKCGRTVYLIDTPGFDDTTNDNVNILQEVATTLCFLHNGNFMPIVGIIYLHRITDTRMAGSAVKSLRIFELLCGAKNFPQTTILTTGWGFLQGSEAEGRAVLRLESLAVKNEFFGTIVRGGGCLKRHNDTYESALAVVEDILRRNQEVVLDVQKEMVDDKLLLAETTVGQYLLGDLGNMRARFEKETKRLEENLQDAMNDKDEDLISTISEQKREIGYRMHQAETDEKRLAITFEEIAQQAQRRYLGRSGNFEVEPRNMWQKSARELELEEEIDKIEMEHVRELSILRRQGQEVIREKEALENELQNKKAKQALRGKRPDFLNLVSAAFLINKKKDQARQTPDIEYTTKSPKKRAKHKDLKDEPHTRQISRNRHTKSLKQLPPHDEKDVEQDFEPRPLPPGDERAFHPPRRIATMPSLTSSSDGTDPSSSLKVSFSGPRRTYDRSQSSENRPPLRFYPGSYGNSEYYQ